MSYAKIRPRRGTLYQWSITNPILYEGELVIEFPDTGIGSGLCKFKIGDGHTPYNKLKYAFDGESAAAINGGNVFTSNPIQLRGGSTEDWLAADPVLAVNEIVYNETTNSLIVGDGISKYSELKQIGGEWDSLDELDFGNEG